MKTFYTKYFEFTDLSEALPEDFLNLFEDLLIHFNGDVSRVMEILDQYNAVYGFFDSDEERRQFEEYLKDSGLIEQVKGRYKLSIKKKKWLEKNIFKHFF
ncbi:MAG: hypothetical protein KDD94_12800, partial [Calditrichaeota bacterium]|nr:hypothetical protein [Calditrichota bacterium]